MINYTVRLVKRFAVLVPGLVIAYFAVTDLFPRVDKRLPLGFALLVTYIITAYVLIPAAVRLLRIIFPTHHLPLYSVTPDGFASDPLNIGIVGTRAQLVHAMKAAGWYQAEGHSLNNVLREVVSTIMRWDYNNAPVSSLYLLGRRQDIAFEIPSESGGAGSRHHVRFWATSFDAEKPLTKNRIHWHRSSRGFPENERVLWLGAASLDVGITAIRHNFQLTHMIDPDTNQERELIVSQLREAGLIEKRRSIRLTRKPYRLANRAWRGYLETDGTMRIITLKPPAKNIQRHSRYIKGAAIRTNT
jgi:hypothetical protein